MNDAEFLRDIAHTCEIGDPVDFPQVDRLRNIADRLAALDADDGGPIE